MNVLVLLAVVAVAFAQNIPFEYIVEFKQSASSDAVAAHMSTVRSSGAMVMHEYAIGDSFRGYAVRVPHGSQLTDAANSFLFANEVAYFEPNQIARASAPMKARNASRANADCNLQEDATWGLVRTAEVELNIDGVYFMIIFCVCIVLL